MSSPTQFPAWQQLASLAAAPQPHLRDRLAEPGREQQMQTSAEGTGISVDFTRQAFDGAVLSALLQLAREARVETQRDAMFCGDVINTSEQRAVLHTALRGTPGASGDSTPWGADIQQLVQAELERVCAFADRVRAGQVKGSTGLAITDVVNIGIGGSDLGPRMAADALAPLCSDGKTGVRVHFVSNPDAWALHSVLRGLNPQTTLIVVASKTFTTQETMTNAASARRWLQDAGIDGAAQSPHLVAITAAPQKSGAAGYPAEHTFTFWDWVGGRYSIWSALGLPLAVAIGSTAFREFLAGGQAMDAHFRSAPLDKNLPVILAMSGVWNRNFLRCPTQLLSTYPSRLVRFAPFVQQMDMESNGKRIRKDGQPCDTDTGPIVWGGLGIDGQHAYFQLLHQGTHRVPVEFIGVLSEDTPLPLAAEHHRVVNLNLRAQAQALALGRDEAATLQALMAEGMSAEQAEVFVSQRSFKGDVPSSTVWLDALTPHRLGALIALYEHKVFVQAAIWGINAYDQWGVELGKTMAKAMEQA
ncbi:MAG: glucose-6-phosphate isomerase [Hydrogenophaga sp.]|uniref:glucose-6-phosphate isomerase n=1 Tax=Hydrogenophaga sp. TaxID=1904254 RepID=UPI0025C69957|nr:glucose-6-phosphate isomerase [Hydrogenophaga sp.]MBT9554167.1 glucose-6-phosphate isomerase [Hydrogenophaga sp.]